VFNASEGEIQDPLAGSFDWQRWFKQARVLIWIGNACRIPESMEARDRSRSIQDLVKAAQDGNREAFDILVEHYRLRLESLINLRLGSHLRQLTEVEDVLQETYLQAFQSLGEFTFRHEGSLFVWLGGIAEHVIQNLARHHFGTQKRDAALVVPLQCGSSTVGGDIAGVDKRNGEKYVPPDKALQRNERFERLKAAMDKLKPEHREVIILARVHGLSTKEIAQRMGRSIDAVSMLLLRALRKLKDQFGSTDSLHLPQRSLDSRPGGESPR